MKRMTEVFWYDPDAPVMTTGWKPNPYIDGEWYKMYWVTESNALRTVNVTQNTELSDEWSKDNEEHDYGAIGDYICDTCCPDQAKDFLKGCDR